MQSVRFGVCLSLLAVALPIVAAAQTPGSDLEEADPARSLVLSSVRQALADPTTYMPAAIDFAGKKLDWDSSQVFFRHGYGESNAEFTTNGIPGGPAIGRGAGDRKILGYSLQTLSTSFAHNAASRILERSVLARLRGQRQRKLCKALFLAERVVVTSLISMKVSQANFRQWQINTRRAEILGLNR